jgi:hypothetical protein
MLQWDELCSIAESITLTNEEDQILWNFNSNEKFSVQSLYAVISHRGVIPKFIHAVWKLNIPPRVQMFLWFLSSNRLLTRDNLAKRREVNDPSCLYCLENESIVHLFFNRCVASNVWSFISSLLQIHVGGCFESVASLWIANKKT